MPRRESQLAKLTRPRLHRAVSRERLFEVLDDARQHPVVWIAGPPGAGKTTLASTYVEAAKLPCTWYQMDSADADPATFFFYLGSVVPAPRSRGRQLPLFTAEYLPDLAGFARRFVRHFFGRAVRDTVLVLDNYHEVAPESGLHTALAAAFEEVPQGCNVLVLSRAEPPGAYARSKLDERIALVDWTALRLTRKETAQIVGSRTSQTPDTVDFLFGQAGGWAAGVVLLLERLRRDGTLQMAGPAATSGAAFDYFASQIFDPVSAETRQLLITAAIARQVTAPLLELLTGHTVAEEVLESFYQRQLFVYRKPGNPPWYHLHALFREFLLDRARRTLPPNSLDEIRRKSAAVLAAAGFEDQAVPLLLEASDWSEVERLLIRIAPALIQQGRWRTLQEWAYALPAQVLSNNPWLRYWIGRSQIAIAPSNATRSLEAAYNLFAAAGDAVGKLLSATGVLEAMYFSFTSFVAMDSWIARIITLLEEGTTAATEEDELRVHAAILMGVTYRSPENATIERCVQRVRELLVKSGDVNLKVMVSTMLHAYGNMAGDTEVELFAKRIARPLMNASDLTAWTKAFYVATEGYLDYVHGRYREALSCFNEASAIAAEHSLTSVLLLCELWRGLAQRRAGFLEAAKEAVARAKTLGADAQSYHASLLLLLEASVSFASGKLDIASTTCMAAYRHCVDRGHFYASMVTGLVASNFCVAAGQMSQAEEVLRALRAQAVGRLRGNYAGAISLNQAWLEHRRGNSAGRDQLLGECLVLAREPSQRLRYRWYANALTDLLPLAIEKSIEPDSARELIRECDVVPPALAGDDWPWPVKIYCLGRFELVVGGQAPRFSRKVPRKALLLLKLLVALGADEVSETRVVDALWPDQDGDAAHRALTATVHRLRRLLVEAGAVRQQAGTLSLDARKCWIDVDCFEGLLAKSDHSSQEAAVKMYRGPFLAEEEPDAWLVSRREKLRERFIYAIAAIGDELERRGDFERARQFYEHGLEADDLVERFYQGLMRSYAHLGRSDDAVRIYKRCRDLLSVGLGQPPSPLTERLYQSLVAS